MAYPCTLDATWW